MFITLWPSKVALVLLDFNPTSFLFESTNELIYLGHKVLLVLFLSPALALGNSRYQMSMFTNETPFSLFLL